MIRHTAEMSPRTDQTQTPVDVRRVEPDDWRRYREVRLAALAESPAMFGSTTAREVAFDEGVWRQRAARPATFIASRGGADIGMAGVYEVDGTWHVMGMWIAPEARGSGVVASLIEACESVVCAAGATTVALSVMEDNPRGLAAYTRLGYEPTGEREHVREDRDQLLMVKALPAVISRPTRLDLLDRHRHTSGCWWDHREGRWTCRRP